MKTECILRREATIWFTASLSNFCSVWNLHLHHWCRSGSLVFLMNFMCVLCSNSLMDQHNKKWDERGMRDEGQGREWQAESQVYDRKCIQNASILVIVMMGKERERERERYRGETLTKSKKEREREIQKPLTMDAHWLQNASVSEVRAKYCVMKGKIQREYTGNIQGTDGEKERL